ncbi:phage tail-collar fiber domain-containing protein [Aeromonas veronii]|uniref:phage tail-collar fiber domain-containing protein n=1 Tax=Aeromonas veronii TaxID=654 RepID=UPI00111699DC|nr:phage tail protein [Aeromonas veronii]
MSQVITNAFETYWQGCLTDQVPVVLDEVVLADIPNLDITAPIDPNTGLPTQAQIVYRHPEPPQRGRINNNAVAYSIVMDTTVGNFSFNAMYLINKASGMVGMIVYKGRETKTKTDQATGTTGNSLVKSMLMEYDQAATATVTTVEAGTWQIDYSARLLGMNEELRLQAIAGFGSSAFFGDGFKLINKAGSYKVQPGVAMVGGLRIQLDAEQAVTVGAKPVGVWVDVHHAGTILSRWDNHFEFKTSTTELSDYTDSNGYRHYVAKIATVGADNTAIDNRLVNTAQNLWEALRDHAESRNHPDASETDKGFSRFATKSEINEQVEEKQKSDAVVTVKTLWTWAKQASESILGMSKIASQNQTDLGAADDVVLTPKKVRNGFAMVSTTGAMAIRLPSFLGGWLLQGGTGVPTGGITTITFPISYPTADSYAAIFGYRQSSNPTGLQSMVIDDQFRLAGSVKVKQFYFDAGGMGMSSSGFFWFTFGKGA